MDYQKIINLYYPAETELRRILLTHSQDVTSRALSIAANHSELHLDIPFIREAAMLHDLGIFLTDAPSIQCFGKQPYICHGILGAQLLRELGYERHARVCERHTGAGITRQAIQSQQLPLPLQDFLPETMEEQLQVIDDLLIPCVTRTQMNIRDHQVINRLHRNQNPPSGAAETGSWLPLPAPGSSRRSSSGQDPSYSLSLHLLRRAPASH